MTETRPNGVAAAAIQQVVQALNVLYQNPDPAAKDKANAWLSEFQKSVSNIPRVSRESQPAERGI